MAIKTSASDNGAYPEFCYAASKHDEVFANFRRHPIYTQVLEHVTPEQGKNYLEIILGNTDLKLDVDKWKILLKNDSAGNPNIVTYNFGGNSITCSPTTLRYIKVLSDIVSLFDTDHINTVAEIGAGYGGQCRVLMNVLPITEYSLVDLPEVLALDEKFLNTVGLPESSLKRGGGRYIDGTHLYHDVSSDLFISNYAFSELIRPVQDAYLEKIVLKAKAGYITWNGGVTVPTFGTDGYSLEEILSIIPNATTIEERPLTAPQNCIIVWGNK